MALFKRATKSPPASTDATEPAPAPEATPEPSFDPLSTPADELAPSGAPLARAGAKEEAPQYRKPRADLYTVLLVLALLAIIGATVVLYLETMDYPQPPFKGAPTVSALLETRLSPVAGG